MNLALACALLAVAQPTHHLFVGTYTGPNSQGIYRIDFDAAKGTLGEPALAAKMTNPSFLAIHPDGKKLYAVGEVGESGKRKGGAVAAFSLSPKGELAPINDQSTVGAGPCHVTVDTSGRAVICSIQKVLCSTWMSMPASSISLMRSAPRSSSFARSFDGRESAPSKWVATSASQ